MCFKVKFIRLKFVNNLVYKIEWTWHLNIWKLAITCWCILWVATFEKHSIICGQHYYQRIWILELGKYLVHEKELTNQNDRYGVVVKYDVIVDHLLTVAHSRRYIYWLLLRNSSIDFIFWSKKVLSWSSSHGYEIHPSHRETSLVPSMLVWAYGWHFWDSWLVQTVLIEGVICI